MKYHIRYIARFLIQADTPLTVGTGNKNLISDSPVEVDANGLPVIPGTSLCGVLRHSFQANGFSSKSINSIFGFQEDDKGEGSRLVVSDAVLVGADAQVIEGIEEILPDDEFYKHFYCLPVRQHCRITHRGVADTENHSKFNEQVVYKGTRFVFELELSGIITDRHHWNEIISLFRSPLYRIGSGTRKGFGAIKIKGIEELVLDLKNSAELQTYLNRSSSLATHIPAILSPSVGHTAPHCITTYSLQLTPDDFFMFGSGYGDQDVNMCPVYEKVIEWEGNAPQLTEEQTLIPATSIKGAISHRTAFHYNELTEIFADNLPEGKTAEDFTGENNKAVFALFGSARKDDGGGRGKVIFSDVFQPKDQPKILNHVAIDRFTGGAIDGALFDEKVIATTRPITMKIQVENSVFAEDEQIRQAFELTLTDITDGRLPLGGGVMRGHGVFTGTMEINGVNEK